MKIRRTRIGYIVGGGLKESFRAIDGECAGCADWGSARRAYFAGTVCTMDKTWKDKATQEVITLLRDDYPTLMSVLGALSDVSV
jgi:hypothetical protein